MAGKTKSKLPIVDELMLQTDPYDVEDNVIHTFFLHATCDKAQLSRLPCLSVPNLQESLDEPFTKGELQVALGQGKPRSAPGHDGVTWQDLRNLSAAGHEALLKLINSSCEQGQVDDHLKLKLPASNFQASQIYKIALPVLSRKPFPRTVVWLWVSAHTGISANEVADREV